MGLADGGWRRIYDLRFTTDEEARLAGTLAPPAGFPLRSVRSFVVKNLEAVGVFCPGRGLDTQSRRGRFNHRWTRINTDQKWPAEPASRF